jgi:hypothetical protein
LTTEQVRVRVMHVADDQAAELVDAVCFAQDHDVVRAGHSVHPYHPGNFVDRGGHVTSLSHRCLDQDVCLDHDPTLLSAPLIDPNVKLPYGSVRQRAATIRLEQFT